ncbi:MAG: Methyltransferase [Verrucomicrobiaceae bacterium]|nr:Methyltransferase [Verrucomicrobiaceae bacterium]MDB6116299.1 Methyltransferase [Verrucomicrobiaceae bacterium]
MIPNANRFSDRVENYIRYRPSYPTEAVDLLCLEAGLQPGSTVVDLGSGTGILSALFLPRQIAVHAVEPGPEMREAAERLLGSDPHFVSHSGTADNTGLPDHCADLITAAQAFHWFDRVAARQEFDRIIKPGAIAALIWNERRVTSTPFLSEYEAFLNTHATDYKEVNHSHIQEEAIAAFFAPLPVHHESFENRQIFDYAGLEGRLMSSSYAPAEGHPKHAPMIAALHELFDRHAVDGRVSFDYDCQVWWARW